MSDAENIVRVWKYIETAHGNGEAIEICPNEFTALDQASIYLPKGAYTTFRTYGGNQVLRLSDHFKRLRESMQRSGNAYQVREEDIKKTMRIAILATKYLESKIRITISDQDRPTIFIAIEPLHLLSPNNYSDGVRVVTTNKLHRANPRAKLTNFIDQSKEIRRATPTDINETLMTDESGYILEGVSSNFFAVLNGEIRTADEGVLQGITRKLVMEIIHQMGIQCICTPVQVLDAPNISEAFITSTSRGVLPVVQIDDTIIGRGAPGYITQRLSFAYNEKIMEELDAI